MAQNTLLGVDVGGTFTDAVLVKGGEVFTAKYPSTPDDQSEAVIRAVTEVLAEGRAGPDSVGYFAHGMTVATNALLEGKGARIALITTKGFEDIVVIGRQARPDLYRLCSPKPPPLIDPGDTYGLNERTTASGTTVELDDDQLASVIAAVIDSGVESVAICLLFSFLNPEHEERVAEAIERQAPHLHYSSSSETVGQFREYERFSTTIVDAYLSPLLSDYLKILSQRSAQLGLPAPQVMQSSGGVVDAQLAGKHASWAVLSGPAGGAVGCSHVGQASGYDNLIGFDMGGTSCDVCVVEGGKVRTTQQRVIDGRVLQLPMLDIHTVGAGGGSIAWRDSGGALRVGPKSAGSKPGPACYSRGGKLPTVTDANLLLGYLSAESTLAGGLKLDTGAAERAVSQLAATLGLSALECAAGIVRVSNQEMIRAIESVTVERGTDPRDYALLAFGGAGPMAAALVAEELSIKTVICPATAGVHSALGLVASDRRRDLARSVLLRGDQITASAILAALKPLERQALEVIEGGQIIRSYDLRYRGQSFELTVEQPGEPNPAGLRKLFEAGHMTNFGFADPSAEIELVTVRVAATAPGGQIEVRTDRDTKLSRSGRDGFFMGQRYSTDLFSGTALPPGFTATGPAVIELPQSTAVVPPGWRCKQDRQANLIIEAGT